MTTRRIAAIALAALVLVAACAGSTTPSPTGSAGPPEGSTAPGASVPSAADAVATYRTYLETNTDLLVTRTKAFTDAVIAGKVASAKALYAPAREPYERIEPAADVFGDLDPAIDALSGDVPAGGTFGGFHRIEQALWEKNTTSGMVPVARKLLADVTQLQALVKTADLDPATIANGADGLLDDITSSKFNGDEEHWSHTDLWDIAANMVGTQAAWNAVKPIVLARSPDLSASIDSGFDAVLAALQPFKKGDGYIAFSALKPADGQSLSQLIDALADPLSQVAAIVVTAQ